MEMRYPYIILIGLVIVLIVVLAKKKKVSYKEGIKAANTSFVKELPYYKKKFKLYKIVLFSSKILCIVALITSCILLARPYNVKLTSDEEYNRDIFLCMDVSASVDELNYELVDNLIDTVSSLKGERFGISIFNTSSVLLVPLTDDYNYVTDSLKKIKKSIEYSNNTSIGFLDIEDYLATTLYTISGTDEGSDKRGSSLIGDGLASCVYSFPDLNEDRTRIIIFSTDNALAGEPLLTLNEAAQISKKKNVIVYGLGPDVVKDKSDYEKAVKLTGGKYYDASPSSVKSIVKDIEKTSKSLIKKEAQKKEIDIPTIPFIILFISIIGLIILNKKVIS